MLGPSLVDHMSQGGPGEIKIRMAHDPKPPETREAARVIRDKAFSNPMLKGRLFSEDGKVICIYLPLTDKHLSYRINEELNKKIQQLDVERKPIISPVCRWRKSPLAWKCSLRWPCRLATLAMAVIFALIGACFSRNGGWSSSR